MLEIDTTHLIKVSVEVQVNVGSSLRRGRQSTTERFTGSVDVQTDTKGRY